MSEREYGTRSSLLENGHVVQLWWDGCYWQRMVKPDHPLMVDDGKPVGPSKHEYGDRREIAPTDRGIRHFEWWDGNKWCSELIAPDLTSDEPLRVPLARIEGKLDKLLKRFDLIEAVVSQHMTHEGKPHFKVPIQPEDDGWQYWHSLDK